LIQILSGIDGGNENRMLCSLVSDILSGFSKDELLLFIIWSLKAFNNIFWSWWLESWINLDDDSGTGISI